MKLTIEIKCDNAAFGDDDYSRGAEIARILRKYANETEQDGVSATDYGTLMDANGNAVGKIKTTA